MAACYNNTIPSSLLNATYGPSAFEAGKYGNKFDIYANTYPSTFDRTFAGVPTTFDRMMPTTFAGVPTPFGRSTVVPPTTFGLPTPFGVESRPCASVCPGINFPVCCPISYERVAPLRAGAFPSTFEGRFGYPSTWAELARCYPSTWERTAFPSTWGYPSWALNERLPSTWGYENIMPSTWNNMWSTIPSNTFVNSTYCNVAFRPSHPIEFDSLTNPIRICDREGNRMLWLCYELKGYKPEEITCTFNKAERAVIVEAAHEIKEGKEHHILRKFYRKFVLPESLAKVDLSKIELKSCLNNEGFLTIECVLPKMTAEEIAKCPVLSKVNEIPFYGAEAARRYFNGANPADVANCVRPVTVKTA